MESFTLDFSKIKSVSFLGKKYVYDIRVKGNTNFFIDNSGSKVLVHNSGKSVFLSQLALMKTMQNRKFNILVIRKVSNTLMNSVFKEIKNVAAEAGIFNQFKFTRNPLQVRFMDSEINFSGIDDPEKIKSFSRADVIWAEECTELDYADFQQLDLRLRGEGHNKQFWLSFNPIDEDHWVRAKLWDAPEKQNQMTKMITTFRDNAKLDDNYVQMLLDYRKTDVNYFNIYANAEWGKKPEGLVYTNHQVYTDESLPDDVETTIYGLDFGYNDPMALVEVKIKKKSLYIREVFYRQKATMEHFINFLNTSQFNKSQTIYCDYASPERISALRTAGYNAQACVKGDIRAGIDTIKQFSLYIHAESINIKREISYYSWRIDRTQSKMAGKDIYLEGNPADVHNHAMDAMRYAVVSLINRPVPGLYVFK